MFFSCHYTQYLLIYFSFSFLCDRVSLCWPGWWQTLELKQHPCLSLLSFGSLTNLAVKNISLQSVQIPMLMKNLLKTKNLYFWIANIYVCVWITNILCVCSINFNHIGSINDIQKNSIKISTMGRNMCWELFRIINI